MSLTFKFDKKNENNESKNDIGVSSERQDVISDVRVIYFIQLDGIQECFNYSWLKKTQYIPDKNSIVLIFSGYEISLKGFNLEKIYTEISEQRLKVIRAIDHRYVSKDEAGWRFRTNVRTYSGRMLELIPDEAL
jgi:hypothetical protein